MFAAAAAANSALTGNQQVCDRQTQPGFTHWGSYAEYVAIHFADENLVRLPESIDHVSAASLGCRFATAFRAVAAQGQVRPGQWVAIYGCGGVGLSADHDRGRAGRAHCRVDISRDALALAKSIGAEVCIDACDNDDVVSQVRDATDGGVHVSLDAFGSTATCVNSIGSLRKRGKHVQVGLMAGSDRNASLPMDAIIANELEVLGSHGMQAARYGEMLDMIVGGQLNPSLLVQQTVSLDQAAIDLGDENLKSPLGVAVIDRFSKP